MKCSTRSGQNEPSPRSPWHKSDAQENGRIGGNLRAARHTGEELSEWASRGGEAVLAKYGSNYFAQIRKHREYYPTKSERAALAATLKIPAARPHGFARLDKYGPEQRSEWARRGGLTTKTRYGTDFYRRIRKQRKNY
jgi:hypothetical protein